MKRRQFLAAAARGALLSTLPMGRLIAAPNNKPSKLMPKNLLMVLVDDLNTALGCYGHPAAHTPNVNRLAARGVRFSHAYCPYPLCGPSRTAFLTGQRPESIPMGNNEVAWRDLCPDLKMLPEFARASGYHTERIGKIQHHGVWKNSGIDYVADGSTLPHTYRDPKSWVTEWGLAPSVYEKAALGVEQLLDGLPHGGSSLHTQRVSNPEVLPEVLTANRACAFLASEQSRKKPFFLGVGFHKPHVPLIAPEKWWSYYDNLEVDPLLAPTAFSRCPNLPDGMLRDKRFHRGLDPAARHHLYRGYLACVSHMDEQLGRVLDTLEQQHLVDDTLIVFCADHGYHIGQQGEWDKMMLLEPSLHIPMIMAGAGITSHGAVCESLVESIDLFPTLCSIMGWKGQPNHGTDLSPWLANPALPSHRPVYSWINAGGREGWSIRTARYRYGQMSLKGIEAPFLFDYQDDPHETNNLAGQPGVVSIEATLASQLAAHRKEMGRKVE